MFQWFVPILRFLRISFDLLGGISSLSTKSRIMCKLQLLHACTSHLLQLCKIAVGSINFSCVPFKSYFCCVSLIIIMIFSVKVALLFFQWHIRFLSFLSAAQEVFFLSLSARKILCKLFFVVLFSSHWFLVELIHEWYLNSLLYQHHCCTFMSSIVSQGILQIWLQLFVSTMSSCNCMSAIAWHCSFTKEFHQRYYFRCLEVLWHE